MFTHSPYHFGLIDADEQLVTGAGRLMAFLLFGGSTATDIILYDNTAASGTILAKKNVVANASKFVDLTNLGGTQFGTGIYGDITGTGALCYVWYEA